MIKVLFVGGEWNMEYHQVHKDVLKPYQEIHVPKKLTLDQYWPDKVDPFDLLNNVDTYVVSAFNEFPYPEVAILKGHKISVWTTGSSPIDLTSMARTLVSRKQPVLSIDYNWHYDTYDWYYVEKINSSDSDNK